MDKVGLIEADLSNGCVLELSPDIWRWYRDRVAGGLLSQLAIHMFDLVNYLGTEILTVSSVVAEPSVVDAEVDDQPLTLLRFADVLLPMLAAAERRWLSSRFQGTHPL